MSTLFNNRFFIGGVYRCNCSIMIQVDRTRFLYRKYDEIVVLTIDNNEVYALTPEGVKRIHVDEEHYTTRIA